MTPLPRRLFLKSTGIAIGLPLLDSMLPRRGAAAEQAVPPRRMVCIGVPFGFDPAAFVPFTTGRDYVLPSHLAHLADFRNDFTVISGLSHPNTGGGGHKAEAVMPPGGKLRSDSSERQSTSRG